MQNYVHYLGKMFQKFRRRAKGMQKTLDDFLRFEEISCHRRNVDVFFIAILELWVAPFQT